MLYYDSRYDATKPEKKRDRSNEDRSKHGGYARNPKMVWASDEKVTPEVVERMMTEGCVCAWQ